MPDGMGGPEDAIRRAGPPAGRGSKILIAAGIAVQIASIAAFFLRVRPLTEMSLICLCFILFAELELFGGMALLAQYGRGKISAGIRYGVSVVSGVYTALSVALSLGFLHAGGESLKVFVFSQLILLAAATILDLVLAAAVHSLRARKKPKRT